MYEAENATNNVIISQHVADWQRIVFTRLIPSVLLISSVGGCGGEATGRIEFSGEVKRAGEPVANGFVSFQPTGEGPAANGSITGGEYRFDDQTGPAVGSHLVTINVATGGGKTVAPGSSPVEQTRWEFRIDVTEDGEFQKDFTLD